MNNSYIATVQLLLFHIMVV